MTGVRLADFAATNSVGLTRFAFLMCGDRGIAEDLVQDAFYALYKRFGDHLPLEAPVAYARRAIVNGNTSRARRKITSVTDVGFVPDLPLPDGRQRAVDEQDAMWRVLLTLPERQRAVLVMRFYLDLADGEIAAALDCREGTVRSLASRAFAALRTDPSLALSEEHR